ncbi:uncharacterized protein LOC119685301 [Teleopsis dalmanni]|uniref:uncharacterized protein LOC119685301 n=1 Tax=Teleopsis dalmanni TaxID=139649 RepID=UPI0018CE3C77|nr:uncharacterized protein LOC119685301 [Teleopsis dalmanni]
MSDYDNEQHYVPKGISIGENEELSFKQLDIMTKWLLDDTEELEKEFKLKNEYTIQQEVQLLNNDKMLVEVNSQVQNLSNNMDVVQKEYDELNQSLDYLERNLTNVEVLGQETRSYVQSKRWERGHLINLITTTDQFMLCVQPEIAQLEDTIALVKKETNPLTTLYQILDCHVRTLEQTEKNLNTIVNRIPELRTCLNEVMLQITRNQNTTQKDECCGQNNPKLS